MRIYFTQFTKFKSDLKKPLVERSVFGEGFRLSITDFCIIFSDYVSRVNQILLFISKCGKIYKEIKFTITFKF